MEGGRGNFVSGEGKLFSLMHAFSRSAFFKAGALSILLLTSGMVLSSCMNVEEPAVEASTSDGEQTDGNNADLPNFRLMKILPSQQSPGTQFDLVGTGGEFEQNCSNMSSPCFCEYKYTPPNGTEQISLGSITYFETDLLRCVNTVPSTVTTFKVRVIKNDSATGTQISTDQLEVHMNAGAFAQADSFLDLSNTESYVPVKRFQCRKRTFIPNPMDPDIIDPFQSEDPNVIYPFNFFTTNVGESIVELQRASVPSGGASEESGADWDCTLTPNADRTMHWWANPYVFSKFNCTGSFCGGDEYLIYPKTNLSSGPINPQNVTVSGLSRSSFMLVPRPYGVFQIPVRAPVAPTSNYRAPTIKTIGYAAKPLPSSTGASRCPSISLPANHRWVKLWQFRADLPSPVYVKQQGSPALANTAIACNKSGVFPACDYGNPDFGTQPTDDNNVDMTRIAVLLRTSRAGVSPHACYKFNFGALSSSASKLDLWTPSQYAFQDLQYPPEISALNSLPWNIYAQATLVGANFSNLAPKTPTETMVATKKVSDQDFVDWLFVVTPEVHPTSSINLDDAMRNPASSYGHEYRPVTFRNKADCVPNGNDASNCIDLAPGRIDWGLMGSGIGSPAGSSNNFYPLCVVQKSE